LTKPTNYIVLLTGYRRWGTTTTKKTTTTRLAQQSINKLNKEEEKGRRLTIYATNAAKIFYLAYEENSRISLWQSH